MGWNNNNPQQLERIFSLYAKGFGFGVQEEKWIIT